MQNISDKQNSQSKMWKTINKVLTKVSKTTSVTIIEYENKYITDMDEIVSAFNRHFTNLCPSLASKGLSKWNKNPTRFVLSNE